jgi:hypothetical protein
MARVIVSASEVSEEFRAGLVRGHPVVSLVQVLSPGGSVVEELETVSAGTANLDAGAAVRGRCDLTLAGAELVPRSPGDLLAPFGNQIRVCRGLRHGGDEELVSLGVFRVEEAEPTDGSEGPSVQVIGLDRAQIIEEASFEEPYQIASGTKATDAILALIQSAYPGVVYEFLDSDVQLPALFADEGGGRWSMAQGIATAIGGELFFDDRGVLILQPVPEASNASNPRWQLVEGEEGVLIGVSKRMAREGAANRVIVTGENQDAAAAIPRAVATDDDPASPTQYGGPFGKVPYHATEYSSFIKTNQQAADAARGILAKRRGLTQQVNFSAAPNPALRPSDVAHIRRAQIGLEEDDVLDSVAISLGASEAVSGATRAVQRIS